MGVPDTQQVVRRWLVLSDGVQSGPFPEPLLLSQLATGRLSGQALVSCGNGWITAAEMAESLAGGAAQPAAAKLPAAQPLSDEEEFWEDDRAPQAAAAAAAAPSIAPPTPPAPTPDATAAIAPPLADESSPSPAIPPPVLASPPVIGARPAAPLERPPVPQQAIGPSLDAAPPARDRVVILGRRQSGKTIFLATLYARLWRSLNGMTARALSGDVHKQLMETAETLKRGDWPAATLETSQLEMEIEYHDRKHTVVLLDFAGELFARAFVHERTEGSEMRALLDHIDRAAAVLLLVDPSVAAATAGAADSEAVMEDDFGLVQAVQRIRNGPGGDQVPIALCLTKMDVNGKLVAGLGGAKELVRRTFPPLVRMLKQVTIFSLTAVQLTPGPDGRPRPARDSKPANLENPLKHCLRIIHQNEDEAARRRAIDEAWVAQQLDERRVRQRERRQNLWLVIGIGALLLIGAIVVIAAIVHTR